MGNHWIADFLATSDGALQSRKQQPHLPADTSTILVTMAEATDDSIIFATTTEALRQSTWMGERFQSVYGWETNWDKSLLFIRNVTAIPRLFDIPPPTKTTRRTPFFSQICCVSSGHLSFSATEVNDHALNSRGILHAITNIRSSQALQCALPFTALRRSHPVTHLKIRPLLAISLSNPKMPPRRPPDCTARSRISTLPVRFQIQSLTLPIDVFGFGFHLNAHPRPQSSYYHAQVDG
ncbi:hypothetical protein HGRIS_003279 [Hohenbuehelia grisea]|uniref:Uncharacterized protein n=1 Tax=Hohenbuehelia grisea TaxID=104357 RepID=A0ABR3JNV6_9AGAR